MGLVTESALYGRARAHADHPDIGLAVDLDELLGQDLAPADRLHRGRRAAGDQGRVVAGLGAVHDPPPDARRSRGQGAPDAEPGRLLAEVPLPLALAEELQRRREHVVVQDGLDLEDLDRRPDLLPHGLGRGTATQQAGDPGQLGDGGGRAETGGDRRMRRHCGR